MLYEKIPGESVQDRACRIVRDLGGCSLSTNKAKLQAFIAKDGACIDGADEEVRRRTNCAEFAVAYLAALAGGIDDARKIHPLLATPIKNGTSFSVLVQIGNDLGAWISAPDAKTPPPIGGVIWYEINGENDDHAEVMLMPPDEHGGGGRPNNAITVGHSDVHASWTRPIHRVLDISRIKWDLPPALPDPGGPADETISQADCQSVRPSTT